MSWNYKAIRQLLAFFAPWLFLLQAAQAQREGPGGSTGGGNVRVCFKSGSGIAEKVSARTGQNEGLIHDNEIDFIESVEAYDLFSIRTKMPNGLQDLIQSDDTESVDDFLLRLEFRFKNYIPTISKLLQFGRVEFAKTKRNEQPMALHRISDEHDSFNPSSSGNGDCVTSTAIAHRRVGNKYVLHIDSRLMNRKIHSLYSQKILMAHERIYLNYSPANPEALKIGNFEGSSSTRQLLEFILPATNLRFQDLRQKLVSFGFDENGSLSKYESIENLVKKFLLNIADRALNSMPNDSFKKVLQTELEGFYLACKNSTITYEVENGQKILRPNLLIPANIQTISPTLIDSSLFDLLGQAQENQIKITFNSSWQSQSQKTNCMKSIKKLQPKAKDYLFYKSNLILELIPTLIKEEYQKAMAELSEPEKLNRHGFAMSRWETVGFSLLLKSAAEDLQKNLAEAGQSQGKACEAKSVYSWFHTNDFQIGTPENYVYNHRYGYSIELGTSGEHSLIDLCDRYPEYLKYVFALSNSLRARQFFSKFDFEIP